ncbi:serine-type D-Ala-D-Ala carboxypeptidase [Spirosoma terrae]|uniref:Peptidase S13 n=1 Tax=Spirosoma terrae TaxID=1968276 RepID=A0A6L9KZ41_9BACT|nr:D-alanyl-D-alanine carboxypeptidase [Spirosoma terrae]NDU93300.1 peptidase S13 [Spirosoma terrae]
MPILSRLALLSLVIACQISCSPSRRLSRDLRTNPLYTDHFMGVALYDPMQQRSLIQHNADKPFTPASNTKLVSFYAGLLSLRDSLPAFRYTIRRDVANGDSLIVWGVGNPLLLHPDLPDTTLLTFLRNRPERIFFSATNYDGPRFGPGWAWDDYNDDYMPELAALPIFGNVIRYRNEQVSPRRFIDSIRVITSSSSPKGLRRSEFTNQLVRTVTDRPLRQDVPFRWSPELAAQLLADTLRRPINVVSMTMPPDARLVRSTPTDSLYKRMLQVSDNQFAEQVLFMASAERSTGKLDPVSELKRITDSLHFSAGSARWVDGSGLSRYNLFTPNVLVNLLTKIASRVSQQRLFALLPAAGQSGTLRTLSTTNNPYIFAKSGSMTGVYNLSGYIQTKRGKVLYFSVMNNNFTQSVSEMRKRTADFLKLVHERF